MKLLLLALALASVAAFSPSAMAEDVVLGPESTIQKDASGRFVIITDARSKSEYVINVERITYVKSANADDNNSYTEIHLGLGEKDSNSSVIKIQQRIIPYERIKAALTK